MNEVDFRTEVSKPSPGRMDELTVNVEGGPHLGAAERDRLAAELARRIKARIGTSAAVVVLAEGGIERSVGKARRIVDHRRTPGQG